MSDTRRRLDDLKATFRPAQSSAALPRRAVTAHTIDILGGSEARCGERRYWLVETLFDEVWQGHAANSEHLSTPLHHPLGGAEPAVVEPRRAMVVDIETGGFSGTPVFLIGLVFLDQRPLAVRQFLARDYPEEEAILRALAEVAQRRDTWVTFNGKTFDEPMLRDRATLYRVPLTPPRLHVDLLHAARRTWRASLPNCRLTTLERHILRRERIGDVPSSDVPDLFHHFMRTGNAAPLGPVLEHNRIDLVSATELLLRFSRGEGETP